MNILNNFPDKRVNDISDRVRNLKWVTSLRAVVLEPKKSGAMTDPTEYSNTHTVLSISRQSDLPKRIQFSMNIVPKESGNHESNQIEKELTISPTRLKE